MDREDIYKYFCLEAKLYNTLINYVRVITKDTENNKVPYKIKGITNIGNGQLALDLDFLFEDQTKSNRFEINIKDLESF